MKHKLNIKIKDNFVKGVVRSNLYRPKVEKNKKAYSRKNKHKEDYFRMVFRGKLSDSGFIVRCK